jgi:hypothetical protein
MTGKITAVLAAAAVLASAGVASAQPNRPVARFGAQPQAPYADSLSMTISTGCPPGPTRSRSPTRIPGPIFDGVGLGQSSKGASR